MYIYIPFSSSVSSLVFPSSLGLLPEALEPDGLAQYLSCSCDCPFLEKVLRCCSWEFCSHSPSLGVTASTPHHLSSSSCNLVFFKLPLFLFLMLLSFGIATSSSAAFFSYLSTTTISGCLAATFFSVWIWKSNRILAQSFSITFGGVVHFDSFSERNSANYQWSPILHSKNIAPKRQDLPTVLDQRLNGPDLEGLSEGDSIHVLSTARNYYKKVYEWMLHTSCKNVRHSQIPTQSMASWEKSAEWSEQDASHQHLCPACGQVPC